MSNPESKGFFYDVYVKGSSIEVQDLRSNMTSGLHKLSSMPSGSLIEISRRFTARTVRALNESNTLHDDFNILLGNPTHPLVQWMLENAVLMTKRGERHEWS